MKQSEVDKQIFDDHTKFMASPYGKAIPDNILDLFEKALMIVPPQAHGVNFSKVKSIVNKRVDELSVSDIFDIIKLIWNTPLQAFYDNLYEAIPEQVKYEKFVLTYQSYVKDFQEKAAKKKEMLATLSDGILNSGGMRVVNGNRY